MNKKKIILLSLTLIIIMSMKPGSTNSKGTIIIEMTNFKSNDGFALVGLYNNPDKFLKSDPDSMIMQAKGIIKDKKSRIEFKDVPYGVYAVSGFHDENNNQKLDTKIFGIPKEGTLTSNNPKGRFGPPKFEDAKFELKEPELKLIIRALYL